MTEESEATMAIQRLRQGMDASGIGGKVERKESAQGLRVVVTLTPAHAETLARLLAGS